MVDVNVSSNSISDKSRIAEDWRSKPRRSRHPKEKIDLCIKLRKEKRMSNIQIAKATGMARSNVCYWLRDHPLTKEETAEFIRQKNKSQRRPVRTGPGTEPSSRLYLLLNGQQLSTARKGRIAEAAVAMRLALFDFEIYHSVLGPAKLDIIARHSSSAKLVRIQVRHACPGKWGAPVIKLVRSNGRKRYVRYGDDDFDFLVGYSVRTDIAYVFRREDCAGRQSGVSATKESEEAWHHLIQFCFRSSAA